METAEKIIIATVKPSLIEGFDFEFQKEKDGTYGSKYRASLTVKIGNDARKIDLVCDSICHSAVYGDEPYMGLDRYSHTFDDLTKVGIEVDLSEIVAIYKERVEVAKVDNEEIKAANIRRAYYNSWIHTGIIAIGEMKKKPLGLTFVKSELGQPPQIKLTYKEETVSLTLERVKGGDRFKIAGRVTPGYDGKYYRSIDMAVLKFAAFVDAKINETTAKLTQEEKEKADRAAKAKELSKIFGFPVAVSKEYKYYSQRVARGRDAGYYAYEYWLMVKPEVKDGDKVIDAALRIKITQDYKYKAEDEQTYSIGGFNKLPARKVIAIINAWISE